MEGEQQYRLTEKGLRFLHLYDQIGELVAPQKTPKYVVQPVDNQSTVPPTQGE